MSSKSSSKSVDVSVEAVASADEKHVSGSITSQDHMDGDEALQLVGKERLTKFSDEYNRRLRRKLVCFHGSSLDRCGPDADCVIVRI